MRNYFLRILLILLVALGGISQSAPGPKKWAVVVGVNDYKRESVTDLLYAVTDAELFASALTEVGGFSPERVFLYTSEATDEGSRPKLTNLIYRLESLKKNVAEEDSVYFYFAGHGVEMDGETFLLTENADNRSRATVTLSALPADLLLALLQDCNAKETLIVLDACRNNPTAGRSVEDNKLSDSMSRGLVFSKKAIEASSQKSVATLMACGVGERSYEWPAKQHGYFTFHLVEGLRSKASTGDGAVSLASLSKYVRDQVRKDAAMSGHKQEPSLRYEGPGPQEWILAKSQSNNSKTTGQETEFERLQRENAELKAKNAQLERELKALKGE